MAWHFPWMTASAVGCPSIALWHRQSIGKIGVLLNGCSATACCLLVFDGHSVTQCMKHFKFVVLQLWERGTAYQFPVKMCPEGIHVFPAGCLCLGFTTGWKMTKPQFPWVGPKSLARDPIEQHLQKDSRGWRKRRSESQVNSIKRTEKQDAPASMWHITYFWTAQCCRTCSEGLQKTTNAQTNL